MKNRAISALILMLAPLAACAFPTHDRSTLKQIQAEAGQLMADHWNGSVPRDRLPKAIARLHPELVLANRDGVDIILKTDFDGGRGYYVPADGKAPPSFSYLGEGVYWHSPD